MKYLKLQYYYIQAKNQAILMSLLIRIVFCSFISYNRTGTYNVICQIQFEIFKCVPYQHFAMQLTALTNTFKQHFHSGVEKKQFLKFSNIQFVCEYPFSTFPVFIFRPHYICMHCTLHKHIYPIFKLNLVIAIFHLNILKVASPNTILTQCAKNVKIVQQIAV